MAKGQLRSSREKKKPKQATAPSMVMRSPIVRPALPPVIKKRSRTDD